MNEIATVIIVAVYSYVVGSITGAYYVVKFYLKKDIRHLESRNVGATNAGRVLGKKGFLLTLMIDAVKAWIALGLTDFLTEGDHWLLLISCLFLLLGHLYPIQLKFHGGKGIVVFLASAFYFSPLTILVMGVMMAIVYLMLRHYTISGFISMASIPVTAFFLEKSWVIPAGLAILFVFIAAIHNKEK